MNFAKRNYEIHDAELLAIVEVFKHWRHYFIHFKHEILMFTDHHNFQAFMKIIKLSDRQIKGIQKLITYNFIINYRTEKRNPANKLSRRFDCLKFDANVAEANRRYLHELQQFLRKKLKFDNFLSTDNGATISDRKNRGTFYETHEMPCHDFFDVSKKFRFDTKLTPSMKNVNRCILIVETSILNEAINSAKTAIVNGAFEGLKNPYLKE